MQRESSLNHRCSGAGFNFAAQSGPRGVEEERMGGDPKSPRLRSRTAAGLVLLLAAVGALSAPAPVAAQSSARDRFAQRYEALDAGERGRALAAARGLSPSE